MNLLINSIKSKQMSDFLFNNKEIHNNEKHYYFWIIDIEEEKDVYKALNFFEEIFTDSIFLEYETKYLMFYFKEIDFEIENIISSIIDDFSFKIKIYASSKTSSNESINFFKIFELYKKYLSQKSNFYMTNQDLVTEIVRLNINDIKVIKPLILNGLLDDPQMEVLIQGMFNNNLNVTQTASSIYMHRNTVIKKLEYIKKETGLNIQKFIDANIMYWLLKIK